MKTHPLLSQQPPVMRELIYDFWWDLDKLHILADSLPERAVSVKDLLWHLDMPYWKHNDQPFQVSPRQVWEDPKTYVEHHRRVLAADLGYPLIIREKDGRILLMDGVHRLLKAAMQDIHTLKAKVFSDEHIPSILHVE
jgi:hypothetical protein